MIRAMIEIKGIDPKMTANNTVPFEPTHPGELLRDEIECRITAHIILMGLQSDYDMQTAKNDKSFAARLKNVRKLVDAL